MSALAHVVLEVTDFVDLQQWVWRPKNARCRVPAEKIVTLDVRNEEYRALFDLDTFLRSNGSPDRRLADERRL